ncbi:MAG: hypothetical protein J5625_00440 [Lachnospiraceae bacterium]|nr:hypothetical protein [Lachnospiraceae bacterium]
MGKQILFCMETKRQAATDWVYINETIKRFYKVTNQIHFEKEFLDGKNNYNSKGTTKSIQKKTNDFKQGETSVIYMGLSFLFVSEYLQAFKSDTADNFK